MRTTNEIDALAEILFPDRSLTDGFSDHHQEAEQVFSGGKTREEEQEELSVWWEEEKERIETGYKYLVQSEEE